MAHAFTATFGLGRDFNFNKRIGLSVAGGIGHYLFQIRQRESQKEDLSHLMADVQYNMEIIFFYRLIPRNPDN